MMYSLIDQRLHVPSSYRRGHTSLLMDNPSTSFSVTPQRKRVDDVKLIPLVNPTTRNNLYPQQHSRVNRSKSPHCFVDFSMLEKSYQETKQQRVMNQRKSSMQTDIPDHLLWANERKIRQLIDFKNKPHHDRACKEHSQPKPALIINESFGYKKKSTNGGGGSDDDLVTDLFRPMIPKESNLIKNKKPYRLEEIRRKASESASHSESSPLNMKSQNPLRNMQVKETLRYLVNSSKTPQQSGLLAEPANEGLGFPDLNLREVKIYRLRDSLVNQIKPEFNKFKPVGNDDGTENENNDKKGGFKRREPSGVLYSKLSLLENNKTKKITITLVSSIYEGRPCSLYIPYLFQCQKKNEVERVQKYQLISEEMIPTFICENGTKAVLDVLENAKLNEEQNPTFSVIWGRIPDIHFLNRMLGWQKVNHFPGSGHLSKKSNMWKHYNRLRQVFPHDYNYIPQTYLLEYDFLAFQTRQQTAKNEALWIMKPNSMNNGSGIQIVQKNFKPAQKKGVLISDYIMNPHLINNLKYDLRIYVLVGSMDPLRIYIHEEGIVKFATKEYTNDLDKTDDKFIHLTNYSVNKESPDYLKNTDINEKDFAHKWSLRKLRRGYEKMGISYENIFARIKDIIIKTFISAEPYVFEGPTRPYNVQKKCFELFGIDILIDSDLKPWLIEVNAFPSFNTDSPIDDMIKSTVLCDTLNLVGLRMESLERTVKPREELKKRNISALENLNEKNCVHVLNTEDWEMLFDAEEEFYRKGNFELLFPLNENVEIYRKFFEIERYNNVLLWKYKELMVMMDEDLLQQVTSLQYSKERGLNQG